MLERPASPAACLQAGIPPEHILAGRGAFSVEENRRHIRALGIGVLKNLTASPNPTIMATIVTRQSVACGGPPIRGRFRNTRSWALLPRAQCERTLR